MISLEKMMNKKSTPPTNKHDDHEVKIVLVSSACHSAKIHCVTCNKWVKWLTREETNRALEQGLVHE